MKRRIIIFPLILAMLSSCSEPPSESFNKTDSELVFIDTLVSNMYTDLNEEQLFQIAQDTFVQLLDGFDEQFSKYMNINKAKSIVLSDTMSGGTKISAFCYLRKMNYDGIYKLMEQCLEDTTTILLSEPIVMPEGLRVPAFEAYFNCVYNNSKLGNNFERDRLDSLRKIQSYKRTRWRWKEGDFIW